MVLAVSQEQTNDVRVIEEQVRVLRPASFVQRRLTCSGGGDVRWQ